MTSAQGVQSQATSSGAGNKWPKQIHFSTALQSPQISLIGDSVKGGQVEMASPNRPVMWTGTFATVYKIKFGSSFSAVRCFTTRVTDQQVRYTKLSNFLRSLRPTYLVQFEYLAEGILVEGNRYPLVKMDFVEGETLNLFVNKIIKNHPTYPGTLSRLSETWMHINSSLRNFGIAHNDLQHGNVIVQDNLAMRLVDYDGFYLPGSEGNSPEIGQRNYQHPLRTKTDYNEHVDNFPALVIYLSLLALDSDPTLSRFSGDQHILFTENDFKASSTSECFRALKSSPDNTVRALTSYLKRYCAVPVERVPNLESIVAAKNAGQVDAPLMQATSSVQISQPIAGQSGSSGAPPAGPTAGQPPAPGGQVSSPPSVQPYRSGKVNPGSPAASRSQGQTTRPAASAAPPRQANPSPGSAASAAQTAATPPSRPLNPAAPAAVGTIICSGGHSNVIYLIYCHIEQCAAILYPGDKECLNASCRQRYPANARFCPQCRRELS